MDVLGEKSENERMCWQSDKHMVDRTVIKKLWNVDVSAEKIKISE